MIFHLINFKYRQPYKSVMWTVSDCIPFTQYWHPMSRGKIVIAAGQVKQIWFHSYLVTVRFLSPALAVTEYALFPSASGEIFCLAGLEMDGANPD